jgi:heat shock protein HslJ
VNKRLIALAGTGLLALTACGSESASSADPGASLSGRTFLSTAVTENGKPRPLAPGTKVRLQFTTDGKLSWDAGCNSSQTTVSTADGRLSLGKEVISTAMGCLEPLQSQDSWVGSVLSAEPAWTQDGDKLVLTTESATISLLDKQTAEPEVALDGTKWKLTSVVDGQTASHRPGFDKVWMTLNGERVTGSTGCNSFQGVVARSTGKVTFGELATTRRGCAGDAAAVEALVLKGLKGDLTAVVDGSNLTLRNAAGGLDFTATR